MKRRRVGILAQIYNDRWMQCQIVAQQKPQEARKVSDRIGLCRGRMSTCKSA